MSPLVWLACLLLLVMPALAKTPQSAITVFAAASLKESLDDVATEWTLRSGQKVIVSYAASSALAKQIEQGAPADIFISADGEWMDYLQGRKRIDGSTRSKLVSNRLVLIVPATSPQRVAALEKPSVFLSILGDGRLAIAETGSVPAGRYARQALVTFGLWDRVAARLAQADNVRAAMAFVARGESPLGIVYATDAKAEPKVRVIATFPQTSHDAIIYPIARVAGNDPAATNGFLAFIKGNRARAIFKRAGFSRP